MNKFNYLIKEKYKSSFKKSGFLIIDKFINEEEIAKAKNSIINFSKNIPKYIHTEYNYGGSELRLWNSQLYIPKIIPIYKKLKVLNNIFFQDTNDFCLMTIINKTCHKKFNDNRWHVDSFSKQNKFFINLTDVGEEDGPFEFIPGTQTYKKRFEVTAKNIFKHRPYFGINKLKIKPNYQSIHQDVIDKENDIKRFTCKSGDILIADTRMLHRDSPCFNGFRISLHCYLGSKISDYPNSEKLK